MSVLSRSIAESDGYVYLSPLNPLKTGQLVRRGNHYFRVLRTKFFGRIGILEYYKPWGHR